ncbi:MAG: hypothetical protein COT84_05200 [Chlamydiae bacterium CG10_big_fil_rev_8_21_14_0_10_35_9]|nr:MAG: hypothetical protein COT84_05200 [Chlamydiae bacterium CG10_big_fil_rev_8_21_14_0_10_35_9]
MKIQQTLYSIKTFRELAPIAEKASAHLSLLGDRYVTVEGYEGFLSLDDLADKVKELVMRKVPWTEENRQLGTQISDHVMHVYSQIFLKIKSSNVITKGLDWLRHDGTILDWFRREDEHTRSYKYFKNLIKPLFTKSNIQYVGDAEYDFWKGYKYLRYAHGNYDLGYIQFGARINPIMVENPEIVNSATPTEDSGLNYNLDSDADEETENNSCFRRACSVVKSVVCGNRRSSENSNGVPQGPDAEIDFPPLIRRRPTPSYTAPLVDPVDLDTAFVEITNVPYEDWAASARNSTVEHAQTFEIQPLFSTIGTFEELLPIIEATSTRISFWGKRSLHLPGCKGSLKVDDLANKVEDLMKQNPISANRQIYGCITNELQRVYEHLLSDEKNCGWITWLFIQLRNDFFMKLGLRNYHRVSTQLTS